MGFSLDAHPNEVTTHYTLQRAGGWPCGFPSGLVWLWGLSASDRHMENSPVILNQTVGLCARIRVRFHTCLLEHRGRGAGDEVYLRSLRVFGLSKEKKNRHFTENVINQGQLSPCVVLKKHEQPEAGGKPDSDLLG